MDDKRILILTADAGFGHRSAANAIAATLQELYGQYCHIEIINPLDDERAPAFLRETQADQDRFVREMPDLYKIGFEASDATVPSVVVESALILMLFEVIRDLFERYKPDVVLTTYPLYQAPLDAVRVILRKKVLLLTVITDLTTLHRLWFNEKIDGYFVSTETARGLALKYGISAEKVHITGIPVHPSIANEKHSKPALRTKLGWQPDHFTILAVGSKRVRNLGDVVRMMNHSGLDFQLVITAGGDDELFDRLRCTEWHRPVHYYNFVQNMAEFMHAADCIITKAGGLIVTEALACGLPMMIIDVNPGQEEGNAQYIISGNAGVLAPTPLDGLETLYHWLDDGGVALSDLHRNAIGLGRPRAAYEIAELVWVAASQTGHEKEHRGLALKRIRDEALERTKLLELLKLGGIFRSTEQE